MKLLTAGDFKNKRVLLRVDFNVPVGMDDRVDDKEDWRIISALDTIKYLLKKQAKVIILSHLGRPEGEVNDKLRMDPVALRLEELLSLPVKKLDDCVGQEVGQAVSQMKPGEIVMLENLRFYPGEQENDGDFVQQLAQLGDVYVNEAFGVDHRPDASIVGLSKKLPSYAGYFLVKEIEALSKVMDNPKRPLVVIIGGAKISTKIRLIETFVAKGDMVILGGALANTVIAAKGFAIGRSIIEEDMVEKIKSFNLTDNKLSLPVDAVASVDTTGKKPNRIAPIGNTTKDEMILDIGPDTNIMYASIINQAKTIIWNGPMGLFEVDDFAYGSRSVAQSVANNKEAYKVVGGGDTIALLEQLDLIREMDHVSTGGGAMLKFLTGDKLPGIEALE